MAAIIIFIITSGIVFSMSLTNVVYEQLGELRMY